MSARRAAIRRLDTGLPATIHGEGSAGACLILPPLAEERKGTLRPLSDLARLLAEQGWTALLYDARGSGEAPGAFPDTTWDTLLSDARTAREALSAMTPDAPRLYVSVRSGARLALELASESPAPDGILLWEPVTDLERWWRGILRRSRFRGGGARSDPRDIDGYRFSDDLVRELQSRTDPPPRPASPARVISVPSGTRPTSDARRTAEALDCALRTVSLPPFWLETGVVDVSPLLRTTLETLADIPRFPEIAA